jgi:hypothetical protein
MAPVDRRWLALDRLRMLYRGFGYILVLTLVYIVWCAAQSAFGHITTRDLPSALHYFLENMWWGAIAVIPGPICVPLAVNLPPRRYVGRRTYIVVAAAVMFIWCECAAEGIVYSWDWQSAGFILDGFLTTLLIVAVCAYHGDSRAASDALMRGRIERARIDAQLQRAHLQLLQAQIEPHFLFNTLSVVRSLAKSDRAATVAMLDNLIHYFGAALPRLRGSEVPLAQEVELVEAYLAICRARMGARLDYEICVPEDLGRLSVPCMVLLTLVENALKHGVSPAVQGGYIHVSAAHEGDSLLLKVADSGRGLTAHQGYGTGLANIRQRLLMTYGPRATLSLRAAEPHGVVASVCVPID